MTAKFVEMGNSWNGFADEMSAWWDEQCANEYNLGNGLKKCYFDRGFALFSFVIFWVLIYQIVWVYHNCYNIPIIQLGRK